MPIPCSHPNCGWITLFVRRFGLTLNIARHVDLDRGDEPGGEQDAALAPSELRDVVGTKTARLATSWRPRLGKRLIRSTDIFAIAIKPFMDRYNYDQDRISACCHHLLDTQRPAGFLLRVQRAPAARRLVGAVPAAAREA